MKKRYWICVIEVDDPEKVEIYDGADQPPRRAACNTVEQVIGTDVANCWSGWGASEATFEKVMEAWNSQ